MALSFPQIDPVLIQIGPLAVRWYALAYILGIILGFWLVKKELAKTSGNNKYPAKYPPLIISKKLTEDLIFWAVIGIIIGGRLGYTLFYQTAYYLENPLHILRIWEGGMSFHGGFLGFAVAFLFFCRRNAIAYLPLMDLMSCVAPLGIGLGRIANFINGELWGRVSDVQWAIIFPRAGELPRHPSQLYEAALEGLLLFIIMQSLQRFTSLRARPGALSGIFLLLYGIMRIFCEFFREPDAQLGFLWLGATMGQILSLPMVLFGAFLLIKSMKFTRSGYVA